MPRKTPLGGQKGTKHVRHTFSGRSAVLKTTVALLKNTKHPLLKDE
jgi:hypothetical protein